MRAQWLLALAVAIGCGASDPSTPPTPSPSPSPTAFASPTPRPTPGCGNGLIDDGEFCDGEEFCPGSCEVPLRACCEFESPEGISCIGTTATAGRACLGTNGTFSIGGVCEGEPCDQGDMVCGHSACINPPIEPTSVCCQLEVGGCEAREVADGVALAGFAAVECNGSGLGTAVVGTCGDDGRCVPRE